MQDHCFYIQYRYGGCICEVAPSLNSSNRHPYVSAGSIFSRSFHKISKKAVSFSLPIMNVTQSIHFARFYRASNFEQVRRVLVGLCWRKVFMTVLRLWLLMSCTVIRFPTFWALKYDLHGNIGPLNHIYTCNPTWFDRCLCIVMHHLVFTFIASGWNIQCHCLG